MSAILSSDSDKDRNN
jgi:hypothetical protein